MTPLGLPPPLIRGASQKDSLIARWEDYRAQSSQGSWGSQGASRTRAWTLPVKPLDRATSLLRWASSPGPVRPETSPDSLLCGLRPAVTVAQIFCLLPVSRPTDAAKANFRWKSTRTALAIIIIILAIWKSTYSFIRMLESGIKYNTSVNAIFFTMTITAQLMFLCVGRGWPPLARATARLETTFLHAYGPPRQLRLRMLSVTVIAMAIAIVEHSMSIAGTVDFLWPCYKRGGISLLIEAYCITKYRKVELYPEALGEFSAFQNQICQPSPPWPLMVGKLFVVLGLQITNQFVWSYLDLFISLLGMGLSARFQQINADIEATPVDSQTSQFWQKKRDHYNALVDLVRQVDDVVGPIILVTYASDLYFICLQTLAIVNPVNVSKYTKAYFFLSLFYIISRTTFMTYVVSNLNEESKRPKDMLFELRSSSYSLEAERLLKQVISDDVALTGCNFFTINRSFLLTVAGTIVTYVVVLVQFNKGNVHPDAALANSRVSCNCSDLKTALKVKSCP